MDTVPSERATHRKENNVTGYEIIANRDGVELPTFLVEAETAHAAIEIARTIFGDTAGITLEQPDRVGIEVEDGRPR